MPAIPRKATSPQSVTRVIRLLEALCASAAPLSLAELARALDTPKSSLAALLRGLADEGFVVANEGVWRLGPGAFGLGSALIEARRRGPTPDLVREALRRLTALSGETALFAVRDGEGETITYVDAVESTSSVRFAVPLGERRPLYATAAGRALLAAGDDPSLQRYLEKLRPEALTGDTETAKPRLLEAVMQARRAGVAQTVDQAADGVTGTAAVIRDAAGEVLGALVAAAPSSRSHDRRVQLAEMVLAEAKALSRNLGYRGPRG